MTNPATTLDEQSPTTGSITAKQITKLLFIFLIAVIALAMTQSGALVSWSYDLPPSALADTISDSLVTWNETMQDLGITALTDYWLEQMDALRSTEWARSDNEA